MKLIKIPSAKVDLNPSDYNSNFHTTLSVPHLSFPSEIPQSFLRWLPLVSSSQGIPRSSIQHVLLTPGQASLILSASAASLHTRAPNRVYSEELASLCAAKQFEGLVFGKEGVFPRLDECSPKDGVGGAMTPLRSVEEVILRLCTSHRATNAMVRQRDRDLAIDEENGRTKGVDLIFLPFDEKMDTSREFRVFCAPRDGRVTGVSQYKWYRPSFLAERNPDVVEEVTGRIMDEIVRIHGEILREARSGRGGRLDVLLLEQGFSFDVLFLEGEEGKTGKESESEDVEGRCVLIELNFFGARSGCGSCLFHWLRDLDLLYGHEAQQDRLKGNSGLEFRISI